MLSSPQERQIGGAPTRLPGPGPGLCSTLGWVGGLGDTVVLTLIWSQCSNLIPVCLFLFASFLKRALRVAVGLLAGIRLLGVVS